MNKNRLVFGLLTVLALLGLGGPALLSRNVSAAADPLAPSVLLPGDATIGPAAGQQDKPQITAGANGYLVVWEDYRTNFTGAIPNQGVSGGDPSGQTLVDIYAARLDASGALIDTVPIAVSQATYEQTNPQVSWNGQNYLVVWNTRRVANFTTTIDVYAARVSPQGQVLDNPAIVVDGNPTIDELYPAVSSDGTDWVVVWLDQGSYFELDATRISPQGQVRDPGGVAIYQPEFPEAPSNPSIAFAGDEYLIAFQGYGSDNDVRGIRINTALQPLGGAFNISTAIDNQYNPEVASNGTDFFVVWQDWRFSQQLGSWGARVTHSGQVLDPNGINISGNNTGYPAPEVAWDGTQWFVTWVSDSAAVHAARVSSGGAVLDPNGITVSQQAVFSSVAGQPGGGARLVWSQALTGGNSNRLDISTAQVSAGGVPATPVNISLGAPSQRQLDLAPNGTGHMAVFVSEVSNETRIKAQRLNGDGTAIDAEPFLVMGGSSTLRVPRVAWNGTLYLVVWEETNWLGLGYVPGAVFGKRVSAAGVVLDANPILILPGNTPDVEAVGDTFLAVSSHEPTNHQRFIKAVRVSGDGTVLGSPVQIGNNFSLQPRVTALGGRWLAAWHRRPTHDNPNSSINANFVNLDGSAGTAFSVAPSVSKTANVAAGPDQGIIVYYRNGDIYARRILPDGTLLDSTAIQVTSAPNDQLLPAVAWDGVEYVVAYEDRRNVAYLDYPVSDISATRVNIDGTVLDPNGIVVANDFTPEIQPAVAANGGSYLLGFSNYRYQAPFGAYRLDVRRGDAGGPPAAEPTSTPTVTPTNTPPVCVPGNFGVAESMGGVIVPGTTDTGNHCDECGTLVPLPFQFTLYDQTFGTVIVTANGTMNFVSSNNTGGVNFCLPYSGLGYAIVPHWEDMDTSCQGCGVFTSVSGTAPNRIFNIEWRAEYYFVGGSANFEVRLYENSPEQRFDIIFGTLARNGENVTVGVQKDTGQRYTQYLCNTGSIAQGLQLSFTMQSCPTTTPQVPTSTSVSTSTTVSTSTPVSTSTIVPATSTSVASTSTSVATSTQVAATQTVMPTSTGQAATSTPVAPTTTSVASATATTVAATATTVPTSCAITFTDVPTGHTFYSSVMCLACQNILGGYSDGTFRPGNEVTRGQLAKIVAGAAGYTEPVTGQRFTDVPSTHTFYEPIERMASRGIIGGYADGTFRPGNPATRGQIAKIVSNAAGYSEPVSGQRFTDVPSTHTFYAEIERIAARGIIGGYSDGTFRPGNNATRGQTAKIVSNTFFPGCGQ